MVCVNSNGRGRYYLRDSNGSVLGKFGCKPRIYRPELYQDKAENILARLPENSVDAIVTDPPYGIDFEQNRYHAAELGTVSNDTTLEFLDNIVPEFDRVLKDGGGQLYMFTRWDAYLEMVSPVAKKFGEPASVIVWDKDDGGHGMGDLSNWAPRHEWVMYFRRESAELNGRPPNVIRHQDVRFTDEPKMHPTQKPRGVIEEIITTATDRGDVVLDPFGGSYATARAAQRTFRRSVCCELDPETHRASAGLVRKELKDDPEYGVDWRDVTNLEIETTSVVQPMPTEVRG